MPAFADQLAADLGGWEIPLEHFPDLACGLPILNGSVTKRSLLLELATADKCRRAFGMVLQRLTNAHRESPLCLP
jgi:hypothetical protein